MLFISRRRRESVHIGDEIVITIDRLDDNKVHLGIHAPKHVKILRDELLGIDPPSNRSTAKRRRINRV